MSLLAVGGARAIHAVRSFAYLYIVLSLTITQTLVTSKFLASCMRTLDNLALVPIASLYTAYDTCSDGTTSKAAETLQE